MKNLHYIALLLLTTVFYTACNPAPKKVDKNAETKTHEAKKTQAFLRTQASEFDPANPNKITGDYIDHEKFTVPQNLPTQHKWIMFEGPVLENDLVAFRYFADSRHRIDIFGKKVSDLVMDTVGWDYHDLNDWGSDILMVGNSLGLGSPAIWYQDSLYTLSDCEEKTIEIIEVDNNKSMIRTTFKQLNIDGNRFDLVQDWSINAGQAWSEMHLKVIDGTLLEGAHFATGFVKHIPEITELETDDYMHLLNWGKQTAHKENLGMAIIAEKKYLPKAINNKMNHAYAFMNANQEMRYRLMAVWEQDKNKVKNAQAFKEIVMQAGK